MSDNYDKSKEFLGIAAEILGKSMLIPAGGGAHIVIHGGTVIITTGGPAINSVAQQERQPTPVVPAEPERISREQARVILARVCEIEEEERERDPDFSGAQVWMKLYSFMRHSGWKSRGGRSAYRDFPADQFERVMAWLKIWPNGG
jgi:hypothetical protein